VLTVCFGDSLFLPFLPVVDRFVVATIHWEPVFGHEASPIDFFLALPMGKFFATKSQRVDNWGYDPVLPLRGPEVFVCVSLALQQRVHFPYLHSFVGSRGPVDSCFAVAPFSFFPRMGLCFSTSRHGP